MKAGKHFCSFRTSWMEEEENMTALVYRMDDSLKEYRDEVMDIGGDYTNDDCTTADWTWASKCAVVCVCGSVCVCVRVCVCVCV